MEDLSLLPCVSVTPAGLLCMYGAGEGWGRVWGSWQSWLLGHRLIHAFCYLSTFCYFPTNVGASTALSLGTRELNWGKGVGKWVEEPLQA